VSSLKLGYVGLGAMGLPMATRLAATEHDLTVWNRTATKMESVVAAGATAAASAKAVTEAADIVFACVTDTAAVEQAVFGENGIAAGASAGKIFVDMSTIHPFAAREFAERLLKETGMKWIDAPVSGGSNGARDGTLIVMAGGDEADVETIRPAVEHLSQRMTYMGPVGAGLASKICNQMIIGATISVIAEALNFAHRFGVSAKDLPDCLTGGWADSPLMQNHARRMVAGEGAKAKSVGIGNFLKDLDIACELGIATKSPMPVTSLVSDLYRLVGQQKNDTGQIAPMRLYSDEPL
jgi:3-hydroxyisobutyrate dehydrogenase